MQRSQILGYMHGMSNFVLNHHLNPLKKSKSLKYLNFFFKKKGGYSLSQIAKCSIKNDICGNYLWMWLVMWPNNLQMWRTFLLLNFTSAPGSCCSLSLESTHNMY